MRKCLKQVNSNNSNSFYFYYSPIKIVFIECPAFQIEELRQKLKRDVFSCVPGLLLALGQFPRVQMRECA